MTISVTLAVSPSSGVLPGQVITAVYTVGGDNPVPGATVATTSGEVAIGGTEYEEVTTISSLAVPALAVAYSTPVCSGLKFAQTGQPNVFTAVTGTTFGSVVSGSVIVKGTTYSATAALSPGAPVATPPATSQCLFGIWDDGSSYPSTSYAGVQKFDAAPVRSATQYLAWLGPFPAAFNTLCAQNGATMYLNLEPWNTWNNGPTPTMPDIAAGKYDSYLTQIGAAVKAGGVKVLLTFAHEMNGTWYPWGIQAVTPAQWVTTWQHVVTTVKAAAGGLASFAWCPNNNDVGPVTPYWPGQEFCDRASFDGYLNTTSASQTYSSFIAPTVAEIRKLTSGPIWNAETGVEGTNRSARITQFVSDMHSAELSGFTWFNEGDYLLQPAELSALTAAVNAWDAG